MSVQVCLLNNKTHEPPLLYKDNSLIIKLIQLLSYIKIKLRFLVQDPRRNLLYILIYDEIRSALQSRVGNTHFFQKTSFTPWMQI
jgi:hypothetical protein